MHEAFLQVSCAPQPWAGTSYCTAAELEGLRMGLLCGGFRVPSRAQRQAPLRREETLSQCLLAPAHHPQRQQQLALTQQFPHSRAAHTLTGRALPSPWQATGAEAARDAT